MPSPEQEVLTSLPDRPGTVAIDISLTAVLEYEPGRDIAAGWRAMVKADLPRLC